jgi:hypothetical protein
MYLQFLFHYTKNPLKCFVQGILVFASVMATLGLQIILESIRSLASDVSLSKDLISIALCCITNFIFRLL